jgi:RNA polymerase sigma-70 factor (ECF subfamily)
MRSPSELPSPQNLRRSADELPESAPVDAPALEFTALVRAEFEWVWRLLRRIGLSSADADDATQQVFLVAARRSGEALVRPRAFLYGTAVRVAANARRSLRRRRDVPSESIGGAIAQGASVDELIEQRRARELLDELLDKLPSELRRVLVLAEIEQLTAVQIGELEQLPSGTVASRLRRARVAFQRLLEQEQHRNPFGRSDA